MMDHFSAIGLKMQSTAEVLFFVRSRVEIMRSQEIIGGKRDIFEKAQYCLDAYGDHLGAVITCNFLNGQYELVDFAPCAWGNDAYDVEILETFIDRRLLRCEALCRFADQSEPAFRVTILNWLQYRDKINKGEIIPMDITCLNQDGKVFKPKHKYVVRKDIDHYGRLKNWLKTGKRDQPKIAEQKIEYGHVSFLFPAHMSGYAETSAAIRGPISYHKITSNDVTHEKIAFMKVRVFHEKSYMAVVGPPEKLGKYRFGHYFEGHVDVQGLIVI